jgi:hypothetical protein
MFYLLIFYKFIISANHENIILIFVVFSTARPSTISYRPTRLHLRTNCPWNVSLKRLRQSVVSLTCKLITKEETLLPSILLLWLKTSRCRGVITGKIRPPIQGWSVSLSQVINIGSVLYTLFTLRSSPFITAWTPDDFICLGGGCACGFICCNAACSSTPRHIRLSTGLFTGSSCSSTIVT